MTQEEIIQNNVMIFDFMGCMHSKDSRIDTWEMESLKYHTNWNWLMPVVERIEELGKYNFIIGKYTSKVDFADYFKGKEICHESIEDIDKITRTYLCVIQFIHHYNKEHGQ